MVQWFYQRIYICSLDKGLLNSLKILMLKKNPDIHISFKGFKPDIRLIGQIYKIGVPSIIMQSIGSIMVYILNKILITFSSTAVAVFGVYFKLQSFTFMPVFGLNNGMIPIIAYNYGAQHRDRMMKTWKLAWIYATAIMLIWVLNPFDLQQLFTGGA